MQVTPSPLEGEGGGEGDPAEAVKAFGEHGPAWTPILFQKAVEYEFNEKVWVPVRSMMDIKSAPKTLQSVSVKRVMTGRANRRIEAVFGTEKEDRFIFTLS